ncbi:MAG TPA: DUF5684 domain-containing protein [Actinomycetota bacterium]|jgi:hypothetical protein
MVTLAQDSGGVGAVWIVVWIALAVFLIASIWVVYTKAGQPGWAAIVPFYNLWILVKVSGKEQWWFILFLIPIANIVALFVIDIAVSERFGKGAGFGVGLALLPIVFYPILAWGKATYQGLATPAPGAGPASSPPPPPPISLGGPAPPPPPPE